MPASAISGIVNLFPEMVGLAQAQGNSEQAANAAQQAVTAIINSGVPPNLAQQIVLQKYQEAGKLTPELEKSINLGVSQVSQIKDNQNNVNAQNQALQLIQQRAQGGLSATDLASLNQIKSQAATSLQGKLQQIQQNAAQRGMGNSGAAQAAQLEAAQGGAQQESQQGMQQGSIAAQNALNALSQQGGLASQMRGQDFSENQARAQAADAFKQFDVSNQIAQQARNVSSGNQAQALNLANAQNVSNANTSQANQEAQRELQAQQQMYQDNMQRQQAIANAYLGKQNYYTGAAQNSAQAGQNLGAGLGAAAGYAYPQIANMFKNNDTSNSSTVPNGYEGQIPQTYVSPD